MRFIKLICCIALIITTVSFKQSDNARSKAINNDEIVSGLKEALKIGTDSAVARLNKTDGYFRDAVVKILFPPDFVRVEKYIRKTLPASASSLDDVVMKMNRAAEAAATEAKPIFVNAITGITIADGLNILKSSDSIAATKYLRTSTEASLKALYKPKIQTAMTKAGVQQAWQKIASVYNPVSRFIGEKKIPTDISDYVTAKALDGLFIKVGQEEARIRKDPVARVTTLLKKIFGF